MVEGGGYPLIASKTYLGASGQNQNEVDNLIPQEIGTTFVSQNLTPATQ